MRHLADVRPVVLNTLKRLLRARPHRSTVIDMGCGDAWLLRTLRTAGLSCRYIGLDFTPTFIDRLTALHARDRRATFHLVDLENTLPPALRGCADIVVNSFNFFELPRLERAFANAVAMLRPTGVLLILTIDPMSQIIAISSDRHDFRKNLKTYGQLGENAAYDKLIDVIGRPTTTRTYKGILYSTGTFMRLARDHALTLVDFIDIASVSHWPPQIYELMAFARK